MEECLMVKECWINLPVKELQRSIDFFRALGFSVNEREDMAGVKVGEQGTIVMLILEETFRMAANSNISDTDEGTEVMLSISVDSQDDVRELVRKVESA